MSFSFFQIEGKRQRQEDAYYISEDEKLFAVCDGVGGSQDGLLASTLLVESIRNYYSRSEIQSMEDFKTFTGYLINSLIDKTKQHIATTMSLVLLSTDHIYVANVGDSRVYIVDLFTHEWLMTKDHSIVQELFEAGIISIGEMRNHPLKHKITKAISSIESLQENDMELIQLKRSSCGHSLLVASDGVMEAFDDPEIIKLLSGDKSPEEKIFEIKNRCILVSKDNCTCIIIN